MNSNKINLNKEDNPGFLNDYLNYILVIKGLEPRTCEGYYQEIRLFLRYLVMCDKGLEDKAVLEDISIKDVSVERINKVTLDDIYKFLYYVSRQRGDEDLARARKVSALRGFFKYMYKIAGSISQNPCENIDLPVIRKRVPIYLELDECQKLIETARNSTSKEAARDYCIIMLFINCGLRLSELVGLDIGNISFEEMRMRVTGKGNKERLVFLNNACVDALKGYIDQRPKSNTDAKALFLSTRGTRISKRRVQQIIESYMKKAGIYREGLSTHKLRHTAATLMYTYGGADMVSLKEILGHESTSTTEIYTHVTPETLRNISSSMPFEHSNKNH